MPNDVWDDSWLENAYEERTDLGNEGPDDLYDDPTLCDEEGCEAPADLYVREDDASLCMACADHRYTNSIQQEAA